MRATRTFQISLKSYIIIFRENFLRVMIVLGVLENQPKNVTHLKLKRNCLFSQDNVGEFISMSSYAKELMLDS